MTQDMPDTQRVKAQADKSASTLIQVNNLSIAFSTEKGQFKAVDGIDFAVEKGKTLAIVGESGCGKSLTSLAIMRLLPEGGKIAGGDIKFLGENLTLATEERMQKVRGNKIAMIFQEPMTALNPVYTIGFQVMEVFKIHQRLSHQMAFQKAVEMLHRVKIPDAEKKMESYPFELSGGMRQRVLIAMALACSPELLIADEPTTALDVTIQAQILKLMKELQKDLGMAIVFITHDLKVVAEIADDVVVMYAGKVVEKGDVYSVFDNPKHPYTQGLMRAIPKIDQNKSERLVTIPGNVPSIENFPKGCRFNNRCTFASQKCFAIPPSPIEIEPNHWVSCHLIKEAVS